MDSFMQFWSADTLIKLATGGVAGAVIKALWDWYRERRSFRAALDAEITRTCEAISGQLKFIRGKSGKAILKPAVKVTWLPFKTPVWDKLVEKIGLLGAKQAKETARYFGFFGFINDFLGLREEYAKLEQSDDFNELYISLLEDQLARRPKL